MEILESQSQTGGVGKPALGAGQTKNKPRSIDRLTQVFRVVLGLNKVYEPMLHIGPSQLCADPVANM